MQKLLMNKLLPITLASALTAISALAADTVFGEGHAPMGSGDAASIRNAAKQEALRDAVVKAIKDATALDASDPRHAPIINEVAKQLRDVQIREERREGSDFVTRIEANVDRRQIKNAIRGTELDKLNDRSFSILMLIDEFLTSTRDLKIPLRDLVEYSSDSGSSFSDKSVRGALPRHPAGLRWRHPRTSMPQPPPQRALRAPAMPLSPQAGAMATVVLARWQRPSVLAIAAQRLRLHPTRPIPVWLPRHRHSPLAPASAKQMWT